MKKRVFKCIYFLETIIFKSNLELYLYKDVRAIIFNTDHVSHD